MILELDCGNSLIKWRVIDASGARMLAGVASEPAILYEGLADTRITKGRLVSVRSESETETLVHELEELLGIDIQTARPQLQLGVVRNGYDDYARLGLDRWLAVVAGFDLAKGACLILDLGTAVTADFVSAQGEHLGGFICPGIELMRGQLQKHTRRIRYQVEELSITDITRPGRNTVDAVERGCLLMLQSFAQGQVRLAHELLGDAVTVLITGGDAALVSDTVPNAVLADDLVFRGLGLACPL